MKKQAKIILALALAAAFALTACGGQQSQSSADAGKLAQIKKDNKLVVYTNPEFPPYEFVEGNEVVGVDIEIAKAIAEKIGVELEVVSADFDGIIASIASGKGDIGLSGFTITEERKESVDFSTPYVNSVQYIIVPEGSPMEFFEDLENKKVGAQFGTTGEMFVQDEIDGGVLVDKGAELLSYKSAPSAMQDLIVGRIDAVVIDELVAIAIAKENPGYEAKPFKYQDGEPVREYYGAAIAKGNEDFLAVIDETINELLSNGKMEEFFEMFSEE